MPKNSRYLCNKELMPDSTIQGTTVSKIKKKRITEKNKENIHKKKRKDSTNFSDNQNNNNEKFQENIPQYPQSSTEKSADHTSEELHDSALIAEYFAAPIDLASTTVDIPTEGIGKGTPPQTEYTPENNYLFPYTASYAYNVLSEKQIYFLYILSGVIIFATTTNFQNSLFSLTVLGQAMYFYLTLHKNFFFAKGKIAHESPSTLQQDWKKYTTIAQNKSINQEDEVLKELKKISQSKDIPHYTVMLPVYKEGELVIQALIKNISKIIYPRKKLQVLIVIEEKDEITKKALAKAKIPTYFQTITVPSGSPQTKGRASNYALKFATGDYIVIYDAEDKPDPYQLLKAIRCFKIHAQEQKLNHKNSSIKKLACVQARLNFYNKYESIISSFFSLEYAMQFGYIMPPMTSAKIFIPLGGTSNHFTAGALMQLQGWDIYNVTEDADIGTRISLLGWEVAMINSSTMEEAPIDAKTWIKQRTRWFKGHMQTFLVHMRFPIITYRTLSAKSFINFISLMGIATFGAIFILPAAIIFMTSLFASSPLSAQQHNFLVFISTFNIIFWLVSMYYSFNTVRAKLQISRLVLLIMPLYFIMHLIAVFRALFELIYKPHYWDKTQHGVSKMYNAETGIEKKGKIKD